MARYHLIAWHKEDEIMEELMQGTQIACNERKAQMYHLDKSKVSLHVLSEKEFKDPMLNLAES